MCFSARWCALVMIVSLVGIPANAVIRDGGVDPANLGKGSWIYYVSDCTSQMGGNVPEVTDLASFMEFEKSQGVRYLVVKAGTGSTNFNGSGSSPQFNSTLVEAAHEAGLFIFGYNRSYGSDIPGEAALVDYVFNCGADGFVFDAEGEWEKSNPWIGTNGPSLAWQLCGTVRSNWPTKFLAHAPFPIIESHPSFPYKEFGYWCDAVMPQIYQYNWTSVKRSPSGGINWSDHNWLKWQNSLTNIWTNSIKPLAPVNHLYGPLSTDTSRIPDSYASEFIDYLNADTNCPTAGGYKGASFWRADLHGVGHWANIKEGTIGNFPGVINNIVLDNPSAVPTGNWNTVMTFSNFIFYGYGNKLGKDTNSFGTNYMVKPKGQGDAFVQFTPLIQTNGFYDLYEWHPQLTNASAFTPFQINCSTGTTTISVNQQTNAGVWTKVGRFPFARGSSGNVRISDDIPEENRVVVADGLKWIYVPGEAMPAHFGSARSVSNGQLHLKIIAEPGSHVWLERSSDLLLWEPVGDFVMSEGEMEWSDELSNEQRFYRVRQ